MDKKKIATLIVLIIVAPPFYFFVVQKMLIKPSNNPLTPEKVTFGVTVPPGFLDNVPIEPGIAAGKGYTFVSPDKKQLTIVFLSAKMVAENYVLYTDFLRKQNWSIVSTKEEESESSIQGALENKNITISIVKAVNNQSVGSEVSIHVINK